MHNISVLIPCYNCSCTDEVNSIWRQLKAMEEEKKDFAWEIIVAEDGSTDEECLKENSKINSLEGVRYLPRKENVGRAAIRNFLAREAQYEWLLFMDSEICIEHSTFLSKYLNTINDVPDYKVFVGGVRIFGNAMTFRNNLRYMYEKAAEGSHSRTKRQKHEYREFRTTNFVISRETMLECPFDENFTNYGFEDVLFGKTLKEKGYGIKHITNPITYNDYEDNETFVSKTEESLRTLYQFRKQLRGYSKLLTYANIIRYTGLAPLFKIMYNIFGKTIRKNLAGNKPRLSWFNKYKLLYYLSL